MSSIANQISDTNREVTYVGTGSSYTAPYDCIVYFRVPNANYSDYIGLTINNSSPNYNTSPIVGYREWWGLRQNASATDKANMLSRGFGVVAFSTYITIGGTAVGKLMLKKGETLYSQYSGLEYYVEKI